MERKANMFWDFINHAGPPGYRHRGPFGGGHGAGHGRPGWWGDWFGEAPPRADRGGVRYLVLDAIAEQSRHGYEIIQFIAERSGGSYKPSPGVIYPTLQMLEELGHAKVEELETRKVYAITKAGRADLEEHREYVDDFYGRGDDDSWERHGEDMQEVVMRIMGLLKLFKKSMRRGTLTPGVLARVARILDEAAERIEVELGEEAPGRHAGRRR
jgi:DNA-binding PadR family transcriptional regulator